VTPDPIDRAVPRATTVLSPIVAVHFDGACQPPHGGIATYGFVVEGPELAYEERGPAVAPGSPRATNNIAEYVGAIRALEWLRSRSFSGTVIVYGDSQLVVRQMRGEYAVRSEHLVPYHAHLQNLVRGFAEVRFEWVPRSENRRADALSKQALEEVRGATGREPDRAAETRGVADDPGAVDPD